MNRRCFLQVICISLLALALVGCARVRVEKIPTPSQYLEWDDDMQQKADEIPGVRFYLPRPFINVFESFPVRTDLYFAKGTVSPDGRYVVIGKVFDLQGNPVAELPETAISKRKIFRPDGLSKMIEAQSESDPEPSGLPQGALDELKDKVETDDKDDVEPKDDPPQAVKELRVTNAPNAFSYQPMRGNFDLVYVPDFEEQYALRVKGGLGRAKAAMAMGQGWSLQGLEATADNSALAKRLYSLIDKTSEMAFAAAQTAVGVPPGVSGLILPQSTEEAEDGVPGTPVTLKITVLHYAAKGLYPVLKPREVQSRKWVAGTETDGKPKTVIDAPYLVTVDLGTAKRAMDFHTTVAKAGTVTIPMYPYQFVSFNTFRYLAVEALSPDSPFLGLYDKTGTKGAPGDRQDADFEELIPDLIRGQDKPSPMAINEEQLKKVGKEVKEELEGNSALDAFTIEKVELSLEGKTVQPTIHLSRSGSDAEKETLKTHAKLAIENLLRESVSGLTVEEVSLKEI